MYGVLHIIVCVSVGRQLLCVSIFQGWKLQLVFRRDNKIWPNPNSKATAELMTKYYEMDNLHLLPIMNDRVHN